MALDGEPTIEITRHGQMMAAIGHAGIGYGIAVLINNLTRHLVGDGCHSGHEQTENQQY